MPTPWARTGSNSREIPGSSHTSSTAEGPGVVVPAPWAGEITQAPSRTEASVSSVAPTSAAREPAAFSASGVEIPSLDTPVAPLGCLAAAPPGTRSPRGVRSSIRKGNSLPSWRILALRQLISAPSGSRRPPSSGPSTSKPRDLSSVTSESRSSEAAQKSIRPSRGTNSLPSDRRTHHAQERADSARLWASSRAAECDTAPPWS